MSTLKKIFNKIKFLAVFTVPAASVLFVILFIFLLSETPLDTLYYFFIGPFSNLFHFGNMLNAAVPLIIGALGINIAMKTGCLNLGGEGQIYLGAFVSVITAINIYASFSWLPGIIATVLSIIFGSLFSAAAAAFSGFCKAKWKTNELITTFLLSCALIPVINYLVTGPFLDPQTSLLSTGKIAENMRFALILKPSGLNTSVFTALIIAFIVHFFLYNTRAGYEFRITGLNEMFARYGGINTKLNIVLSMAISGFLYGLAGSVAVFGSNYAVIKEFSSGLGWSALTVALFSNFSPLAVLPCALFLSWINSGARIAMQNTGLTYEIAHIIQAVIFILSTSAFFKRSQFDKSIFSNLRKINIINKGKE
ncbi:MAG: ABC transporter permease [Treponema sp.]|nr:ABC transporter permease [Treponema sp.]